MLLKKTGKEKNNSVKKDAIWFERHVKKKLLWQRKVTCKWKVISIVQFSRRN